VKPPLAPLSTRRRRSVSPPCFCLEISTSLPTAIRFYGVAGGGGASAVGVQRGRGGRSATHGRRSHRSTCVSIGGPGSGGRRPSTPPPSIPVDVAVARSSRTSR
jgi:hypothetical protein